MLKKFDEYVLDDDGDEIYHYNKELDFDFVPPTNDAVLKDVSEKFGISIQEVEKIWLNIEKSIYGKLKNNN